MIEKIKIGITGYQGFIGYHLAALLKTRPDSVEFIPGFDDFFADEAKLENFVRQCDVVVHLAGMNRGDEKAVYDTNIQLAQKLINAAEKTGFKKHIIFASSTQEDLGTVYGNAKRESRLLLEAWAQRSGARLTSLVIPNVFGPFGRPYYNSVVATFCYEVTHDKTPKIDVEKELRLIYVTNLAKVILEHSLKSGAGVLKECVKEDVVIQVSQILKTLERFKQLYTGLKIIPPFLSEFHHNLFNTFHTYFDYDVMSQELVLHADDRGSLFEIIKENTGGQVFFSRTKPGIIRGNHFHLRKIERFCVVEGEAIIRLRKYQEQKIAEYKVNGAKPVAIDIPIFYTHNIENIGKGDLLTLFWTDEIFNPEDADTYYEVV
jgi:UDP-2-acetamido-2,6-beta-L-arabino-hexul-4-ose reductase